MNILEVLKSEKAKSGKRFGKGSEGPWFTVFGDGSIAGKRVVPGGAEVSGITLYKADDFTADVWQFEPEPKPKVDPSAREHVESAGKMFLNTVLDALFGGAKGE